MVLVFGIFSSVLVRYIRVIFLLVERLYLVRKIFIRLGVDDVWMCFINLVVLEIMFCCVFVLRFDCLISVFSSRFLFVYCICLRVFWKVCMFILDLLFFFFNLRYCCRVF